MIWTRSVWVRGAVVAAALLCAPPSRATIDYTVSLAHPDRHVLSVTMRIPDVRDHVTVQMPAWNALYQIRDFSSHMMQLAARDSEGHPLVQRKLDKDTWTIAANGTVTVSYAMLWDDPGPFSTQLNPDHAFINFATLLLYVPDRRAEDARVAFEDLPESWRAAVELAAAEGSQHHGFVFTAPSYDALVDAPAEFGKFDELRVEAGGRPIRIVIHGDAGDRAHLTDALKRIVDYETGLMRGAPFREYLFLIHVGNSFGGGAMEHMNSTAISADVPPQVPAYAAHEFFHAWNVKRIRPRSLEPVDYTREMWTRSLWFAEGVTSTYGAYTLLRTGLWSPQQFYGNLADQIRELQSRPAHRWQSVEQSSLDAWYEKYPLYTRPEESISYYNKGQIDGFLLDVLIRDRTDNRASLDDVMRALNEEFAKQGRFYDESEGLRAVMESVIRKADPSADADLSDFFRKYVAGSDEIPYADFLARAGLSIRDTSQHRAALGFSVNRETPAVSSVISVDRDGSAADAGLREGDIIVALNGEGFPRYVDRWLRDHQPDERVTLRVQRDGTEREIAFALGRQTDAVFQISEIPNPAEKQKRVRDGLLRGETSH